MQEFSSFFIVLFVAVFFSHFFRRLHLPWVVALILGGVLIGPFGFELFEPDLTMEFLAQIGLVFLMFIAGLETRLASLKQYKKGVAVMAFLNGVIPFATGLGIGFLFGYGWIVSLLLGAIFMSSSIAIIIPSLESSRLFETRLGKTIVGGIIVEDILSLVLLSVIFQTVAPVAKLPLPVFYTVLFASIIFLRWALPKVKWFFSNRRQHKKDIFQQDLRSIFAILIGTVISFELLGLHPIIAGFFAGLVLSDSIKSERLNEKLRVISYGVFIPIFFIMVGVKTDLGVFVNASKVIAFACVVVVGAVLSKYVSGFLAGKLNAFNGYESALVGVSTMPRLSTALAVTFAGSELGLVDANFATVMVILTVTTTFAGPVMIKILSNKIILAKEKAEKSALKEGDKGKDEGTK